LPFLLDRVVIEGLGDGALFGPCGMAYDEEDSGDDADEDEGGEDYDARYVGLLHHLSRRLCTIDHQRRTILRI